MIKKFLTKLVSWGGWREYAQTEYQKGQEKSRYSSEELAKERRRESFQQAQSELRERLKKRERQERGETQKEINDLMQEAGK